MKKYFTVVSFLFLFQGLTDQNFEVGGQYGLGTVAYAGIFYLPNFNGGFTERFLNLGFNASFNPKNSVTYLTSGLFYQLKEKPSGNLQNVKIPLGVEFAPGKRVRFLIGFGGYCNNLFL